MCLCSPKKQPSHALFPIRTHTPAAPLSSRSLLILRSHVCAQLTPHNLVKLPARAVASISIHHHQYQHITKLLCLITKYNLRLIRNTIRQNVLQKVINPTAISNTSRTINNKSIATQHSNLVFLPHIILIRMYM